MIFENQIDFINYIYKIEDLNKDELMDLINKILDIYVDSDDVRVVDSVVTKVYDSDIVNFTKYEDWDNNRNYIIIIKDFDLIVEGKDNE
jgi:hypothetical protein